MRRHIGSAGVTLLELLVALSVLGIALGVSTVALRGVDKQDPIAGRLEAIAEARRRALRTRRPVHVLSPDSARSEGVALPDGRVLLTDTGVVEPMSGRPNVR